MIVPSLCMAMAQFSDMVTPMWVEQESIKYLAIFSREKNLLHNHIIASFDIYNWLLDI